MSAPASTIVLEARGITRRYPGTCALDGVDFRVYRNQVNVLIGENGAGKSTLMRVLAGIESADQGELLLDGAPILLRSPRDAARHGIAIVHQELSTLPNLDLAENIFAGREPLRGRLLLDRPAEDLRSASALSRLHKPMALRTSAGHLSLGSRQIVEIARTLDQQARILILDEPTSALSNVEAEQLFAVLDELKRSGVTIIYISHRLHELLHLGDHFTVLRSGRVVGEAPRAEVTRRWIVERMSGRDLAEAAPATTVPEAASELLRVDGLTVSASSSGTVEHASVRQVSFTLRKGEILGIYGLLGAGRSELLEALAGARSRLAGSVTLNSAPLRIASVADAVKAGVLLIPEDRQRDGLVPDLSIRENIALAASHSLFLHHKREKLATRRLADELNIATRDLDLPVTALSGGNQQKALIARALMRSPSLLLLDEPTRGVDVGAKAEIYAILRRLAGQGIGVLFTSSEIEETKTLADRALVLCQGQIAATFDRAQLTDEALFAAACPLVSAAPVAHPHPHPGAALA